MGKIRIGQIGIGHNHGKGKLAAFRKFPDLFEIVGWCEEDEEWLEKRGNEPVYRDLPRMSEEELLSKVDAVLVECDVWNLTAVAQRCIDAGKHIHMDKPACGSYEEFAKLLKDAERKNLVVQMGYMYRYNPGIMECIRRIKNGELGEIYAINAEMSTGHLPKFRQWLTHFNGGIQYILGSHLIDLIVYLMGEPMKITSFLRHSGKDGIDVADNNLSVLEYENALVRVYVSSVEINGWARRQFVVSGSKGTLDLCPIEGESRLTYANADDVQTPFADVKTVLPVPPFDSDGRYDAMARDFYDYVQGTKENPFSYEHDLLVHKVLLDICGENRIGGN